MSRQSAPGDRLFGPWSSETAVLFCLMAFCIPLFFVKLGGVGLVDPDEPYYAVPALEMLKSGTWLVPIFRGQPWFDKPVLFYWMILAAYKAFGVTEWAARVGSAVAALAGIVGMVVLAPASWKKNGAHILAAIVLATSIEYAFLARSAVTDMTLTVFLTLGLLAAARFLESGSLRAVAGSGAAFGLATLTKGPVGVLIPAIALSGYALVTWRRDVLRVRPLLVATAAFLTTAVPWYAYMAIAHRELVLQVFLGEENLGRFMNPEHRQIPFFYACVLAVGLLPWSAALPAGLIRAARAAWRGDERSSGSPGIVFALSWFAAVVGLFSLSASKLLTYILPAFPAAAFLIAEYWCDAFRAPSDTTKSDRGVRWTALTGTVISLAVAGAIVAASRGDRFVTTRPANYTIAALLAGAGLAAFLATRAGRLRQLVAVQAGSTVGVVLVAVLWVLPGIESVESTKDLVARLNTLSLAGEVTGAYDVPDVSLDFYLGRTLPRVKGRDDLDRSVTAQPGRLWVVRSAGVSALSAPPTLRVEPVLSLPRRAVVRLFPATADAAKEGA